MPVSKVYNGDGVWFMKNQPAKSFDVLFADPPYGNGVEYNSFEDTKENVIKLISEFMPVALRVAKIVVVTPGVDNIFYYPKSDWILCWHSPAGIGSGKWGFCCWQPILVYGKDPYLANCLGRRPDSFMWGKGLINEEADFHPCPKPLEVMKLILKRVCVGGEIIIDPFLGSGTTRIAAYKLGFDFQGCEIDKDYFDAQEKRFKEAINEPLFQTIPEPEQTKLFP